MVSIRLVLNLYENNFNAGSTKFLPTTHSMVISIISARLPGPGKCDNSVANYPLVTANYRPGDHINWLCRPPIKGDLLIPQLIIGTNFWLYINYPLFPFLHTHTQTHMNIPTSLYLSLCFFQSQFGLRTWVFPYLGFFCATVLIQLWEKLERRRRRRMDRHARWLSDWIIDEKTEGKNKSDQRERERGTESPRCDVNRSRNMTTSKLGF